MNEAEAARPDEERLVWTVEEAGRLLGISRAHAYELVARGELPHLRLGRRVVIPKHAIETLLAARHRVNTHHRHHQPRDHRARRINQPLRVAPPHLHEDPHALAFKMRGAVNASEKPMRRLRFPCWRRSMSAPSATIVFLAAYRLFACLIHRVAYLGHPWFR